MCKPIPSLAQQGESLASQLLRKRKILVNLHMHGGRSFEFGHRPELTLLVLFTDPPLCVQIMLGLYYSSTHLSFSFTHFFFSFLHRAL